jgi:hypothetical protein
VRLTKFCSHFMLTGGAPRSASSLLTISRTASKEGENPRELRSSICLIIASSSGLVRFFELGWQSRRAASPASQSRSVDLGTLYVAAACFTL